MSQRVQIDPRGARFTAAVTAVVVATALLVGPPVATVLVGIQLAFFALGAARGVQHTPTAWVFKTFIRPRIGAPSETEDAAPPRFAQTVGLAFMVVAFAGYLLDAVLLGAIATGFALVAALLNAVFGFCLGCEMYLLIRRIGAKTTTNPTTTKEEVTA